jgi:hypothetical protein
MTNFTKMYGMVGVGIVAAIGFVFALSYLSPSGGSSNQTPISEQPSPSIFSLKHDNSLQPLSTDNNSEERANIFSSPRDQGAAKKMETSGINESDSSSDGDGLTLTSLVALTISHEIISEINNDMEFKVGVPVFLHANLQNPDVNARSNLTIIIDVKPRGQITNESIAEFHGDINTGSNIAIETYWQPTSKGDYVITVYMMSVEKMASSVPVAPTIIVPVKVA